MNDFVVYEHKNKLDGKRYIGITCQKVNRRWRKGKSYEHNPHFYNAIQKYGWDNFEHNVLFNNLTKEEAEQKEIELIKQYKTTNSQFGYNIENGGNHKGKMAESTKEKLRKLNIGRKLSKEVIIKMQNQCNISIYQFNKNGELIKRWKSIREASRQTNINCSSIVHCLKKTPNHKTAGGYLWSYTFPINVQEYIDSKKEKIVQLNRNQIQIKIWDSITEISKYYNIRKGSVWKWLNKDKMYRNYYWRRYYEC